MRRGEIWLVDLGLAQKTRPVVILSVDVQDNERVLVSYVPRTTSIRGTRFEVEHDDPHFKPGVFDAQGIGTISSVKLMRRLMSGHCVKWKGQSAVGSSCDIDCHGLLRKIRTCSL